MGKQKTFYENGNFLKRPDLQVSYLDRGYQFGDGVYEVIRFYEDVFFTLEEHLERLYENMAKIDIDLEMSQEQLQEDMKKLQQKNKIRHGYVYLQVTRGVMERDHVYPDTEELVPVVTAYVVAMEPKTSEQKEEACSVLLEKDVRWDLCDIKSLNLLPNVLGKTRAKKVGAKEVFFFREEFLKEGGSSNVFIVRDDTVYTPPLTNEILPGITRQVVIDRLRELDIPVYEEPLSIGDVLRATEIFTTSTVVEVNPVGKLVEAEPTWTEEGTFVVGDGKRGKVTRKIQEAYQQEIEQRREAGKNK